MRCRFCLGIITPIEKEIIIRGGIPGENLFLMDNIEIPNPNHFGEQGTGGGPINRLNTYMVRKVDFYAGAFAAKYGDKASSVMDIALRDGDRERLRGEGYMGMAGAGLLVEGPLASRKGSFIFKNWNMVVFLDMYNLLNRPNIWEYQYNDDGAIEDILQFEIFPVGGVSIEF